MIARQMYNYYQELAKLYGSASMGWLADSQGKRLTADEETKFAATLDKIAKTHELVRLLIQQNIDRIKSQTKQIVGIKGE